MQMFVSTHYAGKEVGMTFEDGEAWKKVFGPVFIHLNSAPSSNEYLTLWENAKEQVCINNISSLGNIYATSNLNL